MSLLLGSLSQSAWRQQGQGRNGTPAKDRPQVEAKAASTWEPAIQKIAALESLDDDWDGSGATAPSHELIDSAVKLALLLSDKGVPAPSRVVPGLEGEVLLEWQEPDGTYTDVEIVRPYFAEVLYVEPGKPAKHWTLPTA